MTEYIYDTSRVETQPEQGFTGETVVRCRDCYFAEEIEGGYWCDRFDCGKENVTPNGFCVWGERRDR